MAGERKIIQDNLKRVLLKEYVMEETARAGFGGLDIQRTPMGTRITLFAERPGIVIGRRGVAIKALTAHLDGSFQLDNPQIEVEEVPNPALNAQIMAEKLSNALERGWHFRRAGHSTLRRIMESGAKGALIKLSGKLTSQRHRTQKFKAGHVKYCGEPKDLFVDQGFSTAKLKRGTIGVTVWITDPRAKLPDEIEVEAPVVVAAEVPSPAEAEEEAVAAEAAQILARTAPEGGAEEPPDLQIRGRGERKLKRLQKAVRELTPEAEVVSGDLPLEEPEEEPEEEEKDAEPESSEKAPTGAKKDEEEG